MEPSPNKKAKLPESNDPSEKDTAPDAAAMAEDSSAVDHIAAMPRGNDAAVSAEESLLIRRRAMNTIHSRRKRERQRIEIEVLKEQCAEYNAKNSKLRNENAQMELLLQGLQPQMPAFQPPTAATLPTHASQNLTHAPQLAPSSATPYIASSNEEILQSFLQSQPWSSAPSFLPAPQSMMYAAPHPSMATGDLGRRAASVEAPTAFAPTGWPSVNDIWVQQVAALALAQLQQQQQMQQQQQQWQQQQQLQQQWQQQLQQQLQQPSTQQLFASLPPSLNIQLLQQLLQAQNTTDAKPHADDNANNDVPPPPPV